MIGFEIDVCLVSELWFKVQRRSENIGISNYTFQHVDHNPTNSTESLDGDVARYWKTKKDVTKLNVVVSEDIELTWFLSKALKLYLVVVYNPQHSPNEYLLLSHLRNSVEKIAVETPGTTL